MKNSSIRLACGVMIGLAMTGLVVLASPDDRGIAFIVGAIVSGFSWLAGFAAGNEMHR